MTRDQLVAAIIAKMREVDDPILARDNTSATEADYAALWDGLLTILDECGVDRRVAFPMPEKVDNHG
jgi:hypothetical protein